jgi:hypothetical protein
MPSCADSYPKVQVIWGEVRHEVYDTDSSTYCSCWKDMRNGLPVLSSWWLSLRYGYIAVEYDNTAWTKDELVALYHIVQQKFIDAGYASPDTHLGLVGVAVNLANSPARDLI